jgi:hypothetical protein
MTRRRIGILLGIVGILLQGCPLAWERLSINQIIKEEDVAFIAPGATTLEDVVRELGAPYRIQATKTGSLVRYRFLDVKYFRSNLTRPLPYIFPALQAVPGDLYEVRVSSGGIGADELEIGFNKNWTVVHYAFARHAKASRYLPF